MQWTVTPEPNRNPKLTLLDGSAYLTPEVVGSKAVGLNAMRRLALPVPPAFVIPIELTRRSRSRGYMLPEQAWDEVQEHLSRLESETNLEFGDKTAPLLLAIRSGARRSMPGMLDTVLNVGEVEPLSRSGALLELRERIEEVMRSSESARACAYRGLVGMEAQDADTAVIVQAMARGNCDRRSGSGVAAGRHPITGEAELFGEWLAGAQGDELMSGARTPNLLAVLATELPSVHGELEVVVRRLEDELREAIEVEFTVESGRLFLLQMRSAQVIGRPAGGRACGDRVPVLVRGMAASPGVGSGRAKDDIAGPPEPRQEPAVLVREFTRPADVEAMLAASAVVTVRGGITSHAAVICREAGIPCVVGCGSDALDLIGQMVTVDGGAGTVSPGLPLRDRLP